MAYCIKRAATPFLVLAMALIYRLIGLARYSLKGAGVMSNTAKRLISFFLVVPVLMGLLAVSGGASGGIQLKYELVEGGAVITGFEAGDDDIVQDFAIPPVLDGHPVIAIGDEAFAMCWYVMGSIVIPDGVTSIGAGAFRSCPNISKIVIPKTVTSIGNNAFADCENLTDAAVPSSVTHLGSDIFSKASKSNSSAHSEPVDQPSTHLMDGMGGVYEGDYDANGKRSGQGTWAYCNYLYVGNWENDMPNGRGTLYFYEIFRDEKGKVFQQMNKIVQGNWVNGFPDGTVYLTTAGGVGEYIRQEAITYRVNKVKDGFPDGSQWAMAAYEREAAFFDRRDPIGSVAGPWHPQDTAEYWSLFLDPASSPPWELFEKYPNGQVEHPPMERLQNVGIGVSPGNLGNPNVGAYSMAPLGDWVLLIKAESQNTKGGDIARNPDGSPKYNVTLHKMNADGLRKIKLYEGEGSDHFVPASLLQTIGGWLYLGDPYKMKADDMQPTRTHGQYISGLVVDDWEYAVSAVYDEAARNFAEDSRLRTVRKTKLDFSERIELGTFEVDQRILDMMVNLDVISVDDEWVYVYGSNDTSLILGKKEDQVSQLIKLKKDGSGESQSHLFRERVIGLDMPKGMPQIVGGRMYYMEVYETAACDESALFSVDLNFEQPPVELIPRSKQQHITCFNVTEDAIYYGVVSIEDGKGAIMRADLDGGNRTVLADGFDAGGSMSANGFMTTGYLRNLLITGDWMLIHLWNQWSKLPDIDYLMKLDGSDLHKVEEAYIPHDAPGMVDATGKWRYELLPDGSARILGAGSKLKQSGKLQIPAKVDKIAVTSIGEGAFCGCDGFTSVIIPKGVTEIGNEAFFFCKGLTSATIPEGVTSIGEGAFQHCAKLKKLALPASLNSVGEQAFADCPAIKLSVAKKNEVFEVRDGVLATKSRS